MYESLGPDPRCQIIRTLDVVGEKWSLLIVRDAHRGLTRFGEFHDSLGAPTDILTARLASLVERGVLEKRPYREAGSRERFSYHLTEAGEALRLVLAAMIQWSDAFDSSSRGPAFRVVDAADRHSVSLAFVTPGGAVVEEAALVSAV